VGGIGRRIDVGSHTWAKMPDPISTKQNKINKQKIKTNKGWGL
jgi:hypothetical protein